MTEKRFRVQEHCLRSSYGIEAENWLVTNDNHSVVLNNKAEAHMVANMFNDVIDGLNELNDENEESKHNNKMLSMKMSEIYTKYCLLNEFSEDTNPNDAVKRVLSELMQITKEYR